MALEIKYSLKNFDKDKIIDKFEMQKGGNAELFLANTCFKRMAKYTPWKTGTMATTVSVTPGKITYNEEYALYQYEGITKGPVKHYSNNASGIRGKYWDKRMYNAEKDLVVKELEGYVSLKGYK